MDTIQILVTEKDTGKRADVFLVEQLQDLSRSAVQILLENGHITVNGKPCRKNYSICEGDSFVYIPEEPVSSEILV
jgi:23S rRNA pseudouridine1911/1915/1917 synthase